MKIAVLTDIHDHIWNLEKAVSLLKKNNCQQILALGDYCSPFTIKILSETNLPIQAVFGNNDADQAAMIAVSERKIEFTSVGNEYKEVELDNKKIAFTHYPKLGKMLAQSGKFDAVFYGHNHIQNLEKIGQTIFCNPGPLCGIGRSQPAVASFAIYDTSVNDVKIIKV